MSDATKLTDRQLAVLKELSAKGAVAHYMPYMGRFNENPYWFLSTTMNRATREINALKERGFIDVTAKDRFGNQTIATINDKGRKVLDARSNRPRMADDPRRKRR